MKMNFSFAHSEAKKENAQIEKKQKFQLEFFFSKSSKCIIKKIL